MHIGPAILNNILLVLWEELEGRCEYIISDLQLSRTTQGCPQVRFWV